MKFAVFDHLDRSGPDLGRQYEDRLRLTEIYEWAGFHAYHVAEHHGTPLGSAPSPGLFLAAVAQRTTKLRFGPLAYPLGLYHPLRLIEEICMLDVMSGGRLELGVGRGASPYEAAFFGIEPATAQERFDETLEIVLKGLGAPRLDHAGKFFTLMDIPLVMQPVQRPHPPLWHVTRSLESADRLAKQAQERMTTIKRQATQAEKAKQAAERRTETAVAGPQGTPPDVTLHDSQFLEALTKDQLLHLTEDLELESQPATSKQELIEVIIRSGGVPASALSKEELLRIARSTGSEVGTSMTKAELITAIDASLAPVAGH